MILKSKEGERFRPLSFLYHEANETIDYKFLPYDKFCDFIQSEAFAASLWERFPAYQNALETYVKQVLKDVTCKK